MRLRAMFSKTKLVILGLVIILVVGMAFSTKVVSLEEAAGYRTGTSSLQANPGVSTSFADKTFLPVVVPYVMAHAVDVLKLDKAIQKDMNTAGKTYGHQDGPSNAFAVPVKLTGTAEAYVNDFLPVTVPGLTKGVTIYIQMGPALNGTTLRDVTGTVTFEQFVNQLAYQDAATKLNDKVRELVLAKIDKKSLVGKKVTITGAFSVTNLQNYIVMPIKIEISK